MIIRRALKLVVNPEEYESITIEGEVSHDFGDDYIQDDEPMMVESLQRVLDAAMEEDIAAAAYVVNENKDSFIKHWKVEA